ncbi:hypothetical protein IG631_12382 [Alternaria alternata]|nr:hypothetical protein IG631_12382 [Alternaria alternata]
MRGALGVVFFWCPSGSLFVFRVSGLGRSLSSIIICAVIDGDIPLNSALCRLEPGVPGLSGVQPQLTYGTQH